MKEKKSTERSKPWYSEPLFIVFVTFVLTTLVGGFLERACVRSDQEAALKLAFSGEVKAIRGALESTFKHASSALQQQKTLKRHEAVYPHAVFDANVANLGNLHERDLIKKLSVLYSMLERNNEFARRIDEGVYEPKLLRDYVYYLAYTWKMAIDLDMQLQEQTKEFQDLDWKVKVSKKDADDHNLANDILRKIEDKK